MNKYICIHGHFYQPPRENAWLEEVELQDSAYPYHDWNERITAECYAPNTASRILDTDGKITDIVSNYSKMSFNFGPSLLSWMERHSPEIYQAILEADRKSMQNFSGHGSAIAQVYNHMIMPLANRRDKYTQVVWGVRDFEQRFKRFPEGMWLPETAVDHETLEILADIGITFTILAPHQARKVKKIEKQTKWQNTENSTVDPTTAYICRLPSGKQITLFFYDGPISRDIAFGGLLGNGEDFAKRLINTFSDKKTEPQLLHIATDGETYGHHHHGGDMALAYCLHYIETKKNIKLTNYAEYLEKHPPAREVIIHENSSWSCIHGVERWKDNCGCSSGMHTEWNQKWRRPLREALDEIRFSSISIFENGLKDMLKDQWKARDEYISVILDRSEESLDEFFLSHSKIRLSKNEKTRALKLLEMQRNAMLMYTSCGWFFDEISGIETMQILQYASKVIQLATELSNTPLEPQFLEILETAPSNIYKSCREPYEKFIKKGSVNLLRVGAHYGISSLFHEYPAQIKLFSFTIINEESQRHEGDKKKLLIGKAKIISDITGEENTITFAILSIGYHDITAGVRYYVSNAKYTVMKQTIEETFEKGDMPSATKLIHNNFTGNVYSLSHLFRDEQRKIINKILRLANEGIDTSFRQIYDNYCDIMDFFQSLQIEAPKSFSAAAEHITNRDLLNIFSAEEINTKKLEKLIRDIERWSIDLDKPAICFVTSSRINTLMEELSHRPEDISRIMRIEEILKLIRKLPIELDLWKAQNTYFSIGKKHFIDFKGKAANGIELQNKWIKEFKKLGQHLHVKVT